MSGRSSAALLKVAKFTPEDPEAFARQLARFAQALASKDHDSDHEPPVTITPDKKKATYNARLWEVTRVDPTAGAVAIVLPAVTGLGVVGSWLAVKNATASTNNIVVSAVGATIDGAASFTMNVARQFIWFYATPDGWERASTS